MGLPLTTTTAAEAYAAIRNVGRSMNTYCLQLQEQLAAGTVYAAFLLDVLTCAQAGVTEVVALRAVPGLGAYAAAQLGDPDLDFTPPLTQAMMALANLAATIVAEYPKTADGFLADRMFGPDNRIVGVTLPAASLPQTAQAAATFIATLT